VSTQLHRSLERWNILRYCFFQREEEAQWERHLPNK
jgi:hypothetical protein